MLQYQKLAVFEKEGLPFQADSSPSTVNNDGFQFETLQRDKIGAALKLVKIREPQVLIQFWSSHGVGKDQVLTNKDQPYGLGDAALLSYRKNSECNVLIAENAHLNPPGRVFKQRLPEWTSDLSNYLPEDFPQQECAIHCNLHGYLALPVFDKTTERLCVGVLELLGSSKYTSFSYEVKQVHDALQKQNLTCHQPFEQPALNVRNELDQNVWDNILKRVCSIHKLPLAQTWKVVSPSFSFVSHDKIIVKTCNSFDTNCIDKVCISTSCQPLYFNGSVMWDHIEECTKIHLEESKGVVGRALSSHGLWYCRDVTNLNKEEYPPPLANCARNCNLTGCFAISLHGGEGNAEYVLEFFLRSGMKDDRLITIKDVVRTLKGVMVEASARHELGDTSTIQEV